MLSIEVTDDQDLLNIDTALFERAARAVLLAGGVTSGELSIAVVDDPTIHQLNREFLQHDYPTDVLSFLLERDGPRLEGEVVVSSETALRSAEQFGWSAENELLLYVIHGTLHLVGFDDITPDDRATMRAEERKHLKALGIEVPEPKSPERTTEPAPENAPSPGS